MGSNGTATNEEEVATGVVACSDNCSRCTRVKQFGSVWIFYDYQG